MIQFNKQFLFYVFAVLSLLLLVDFGFSKSKSIEKIQMVKKTHQDYYNAGGNSHFSYELVTLKKSYFVSEEFSKELKQGSSVQINHSLLFNQCNKISILNSPVLSEVYSLRWFSNLVIPILFLLVFAQNHFSKIKPRATFLISGILVLGAFIFNLFF